MEVFLVAASLGHALSLASSSFVEEEHQTAYLVSSTLILLLLVTDKDGTILSTSVFGLDYR